MLLKNYKFKNKTIPFLAERLEHVQGYLSNFIRFLLCPSSISSSASSPTVVAALHAFCRRTSPLERAVCGKLAIHVKIGKLFFDPLTDQLAFQMITSSSLDSKVDQHYAIGAIEHDHSAYSFLPQLNGASKFKFVQTRV